MEKHKVNDVKGYEKVKDIYYFDVSGNVYGKYNKKLKPILNQKGYERIYFVTKCGGRQISSIHRLIAIALIPNIKNYEKINHINEMKRDNRIENLEWITHLQNVRKYYENKKERG